MSELAKRAVACKHWRWMPGMAVTAYGIAGRVWMVSNGWVTLPEEDGLGDNMEFRLDDGAATPDLRDPATMGCLLALVREAWGELASIVRHSEGWTLQVFNTDNFLPEWPLSGEYPTEAEALVAALEAE